MTKKIVIIGSGFAGLSAAGMLAKQGHRVTLLEKNEQTGGRARIWQSGGFTFDMGPSWYWMPEVFEQYYRQFGKTTADFYELQRLDPSYRIFFSGRSVMDVPADASSLVALFEKTEKGSGKKLQRFLKDAAYKYETAMRDYVYRLNDSVTEFFDINIILKSFSLTLFKSLRNEVRALFTHPHLVSLLEFPVLFLGASPDATPALYSMLNHADLSLGTWYPMGGMHKIVEAMTEIARQEGVTLKLGQEVKRINIKNGKAVSVTTDQETIAADMVVAGSDYHHTEQQLLDKAYRTYDEDYWNNRTMSPSSLLFYLGVNKKLPGLLHHNLFFDEDFEQHAHEIYHRPSWPTAPLFYACVPSVTDASVAPAGMENVFLLMPLAAGLTDTPELREKYFDLMLDRIEKRIREPFRNDIVIQRSYCIRDFERDYHSYKGNAYGLANTLMQTAIFKPKMKSPKVKNLYYAGQLTVPGPGVPPSIISGQIAAREINKQFTRESA